MWLMGLKYFSFTVSDLNASLVYYLTLFLLSEPVEGIDVGNCPELKECLEPKDKMPCVS